MHDLSHELQPVMAALAIAARSLSRELVGAASVAAADPIEDLPPRPLPDPTQVPARATAHVG